MTSFFDDLPSQPGKSSGSRQRPRAGTKKKEKQKTRTRRNQEAAGRKFTDGKTDTFNMDAMISDLPKHDHPESKKVSRSQQGGANEGRRESEEEEDEEERAEIDRLRQQNADSKRMRANHLYKEAEYEEAISLYSASIDLVPLSQTYGNRSAALMMVKRYLLALQDCREALRLDPEYYKAHLRAAKCHRYLGNYGAAQEHLEECMNIPAGVKEAQAQLKILTEVSKTWEVVKELCAANQYSKAWEMAKDGQLRKEESIEVKGVLAEAALLAKDFGKVCYLLMSLCSDQEGTDHWLR